MKNYIHLFVAILFLLTACKKEAVETNITCEEGYSLNDIASLPNGIDLRVIEVNDYFCPCDVVCVWGGYLEVIVQVEGANRGPDTLGWQDRVATYGDLAVTLGEIYNSPECGGSLRAEAFCFELKVE